MKKLISLLLCAVLVLGLCACGASGTAATTAATTAAPEARFSVGYGRVDITPEKPVALMGYGRTTERMSTGYLDPLYFSCVAMRDTEGNTILMLSVDNCTGAGTDAIKAEIENRLDIPAANVTITATHTHSGPDMDATSVSYTKPYVAMYTAAGIECAEAAVADLKPAEMYYSTIETEGLNFVRHYRMVDGSYAGDNFGDFSIGIEDYATPTDTTMHLLRFAREGGKDVLMMNWRAHATITGGSSKTDVSADFVGAVRLYLEEQLDCHFAYYQGCAGNVNPRSRIEADKCTDKYMEYGRLLGDFAIRALKTEEKLPTGTVRGINYNLETQVNHSLDHLYSVAKEISDYWNKTGDTAGAKKKGAEYGIRTPYMAGSIVKRTSFGPTYEELLTCIAIGDSIAFATAPNELFDTNGQFVEDNSPFARTVVLGYTNGQRGYVPSALAYEYTCYESDTTKFASGTGELIADTLLDMLGQLKND